MASTPTRGSRGGMRGNGTITALASVARDPSLVDVEIDGQIQGAILRGVVADLGLRLGQRLTIAARAQLGEALDVAAARTTALRLLGRGDRSAARLAEELVARGHRVASAERVVRMLVEDGWLDEERFAHARAAALAERGTLSREGLRQRLAQAGVDDATAERAASSALPAAAERALAKRLAARGFASGVTRSSAARVARSLERGGFDADTIASILRSFGVDSSLDA